MKPNLVFLFLVVFSSSSFAQEPFFWKLDIQYGTEIKGHHLKNDYPDVFHHAYKNHEKTFSSTLGVDISFFKKVNSLYVGLGMGYERNYLYHKVPVYIAIEKRNDKYSHFLELGAGQKSLRVFTKDLSINNYVDVYNSLAQTEYEINLASSHYYTMADYCFKKQLSNWLAIGAGLKYALYFVKIYKKTNDKPEDPDNATFESITEPISSLSPYISLSFKL